MDQLQFIEGLKNVTKTSFDTALNYASKSIMPGVCADKTDFLILILLGLVVLMFCYFGRTQNNSKET